MENQINLYEQKLNMVKDEPTKKRIAELHPLTREKVLNAVLECDQKLSGRAFIRITQGMRTFPEQTDLWNQGRITKGPNVTKQKPLGSVVTNAKAGQSYHNYGLAIDYCLIVVDENGKRTVSWDMVKDFDNDKIADWKEIYDIFKLHGFQSGADWKSFKDYPHMEMTFGYKVNELLELYNKKHFIPNTNFVNIVPKTK